MNYNKMRRVIAVIIGSICLCVLGFHAVRLSTQGFFNEVSYSYINIWTGEYRVDRKRFGLRLSSNTKATSISQYADRSDIRKDDDSHWRFLRDNYRNVQTRFGAALYQIDRLVNAWSDDESLTDDLKKRMVRHVLQAWRLTDDCYLSSHYISGVSELTAKKGDYGNGSGVSIVDLDVLWNTVTNKAIASLSNMGELQDSEPSVKSQRSRAHP